MKCSALRAVTGVVLGTNFGNAYCTPTPPIPTLQELAAGPFLGEVDVKLVEGPLLLLLRVDGSQGLSSLLPHKAFEKSLHMTSHRRYWCQLQSPLTHSLMSSREWDAPLKGVCSAFCQISFLFVSISMLLSEKDSRRVERLLRAVVYMGQGPPAWGQEARPDPQLKH